MPSFKDIGRSIEDARQSAASKVADVAEAVLTKRKAGPKQDTPAAPAPAPKASDAIEEGGKALRNIGSRGDDSVYNKKCGGSIKKFAKGGSVDGIAQRGKTRGKFI